MQTCSLFSRIKLDKLSTYGWLLEERKDINRKAQWDIYILACCIQYLVNHYGNGIMDLRTGVTYSFMDRHITCIYPTFRAGTGVVALDCSNPTSTCRVREFHNFLGCQTVEMGPYRLSNAWSNHAAMIVWRNLCIMVLGFYSLFFIASSRCQCRPFTTTGVYKLLVWLTVRTWNPRTLDIVTSLSNSFT